MTSAIDNIEASKTLLIEEADILERISEDMQRYALKHDGVRRFLTSAEERTAATRALMVLAGHRNATSQWRID